MLATWAWVVAPMATGSRTLLFRDVFTTHLPLKAFGAEQLRAGRIPAINPSWGLGQVYRGNPNALPYYPGNLLYLVLPFWSAFNLHYALHWLLAALTMAALARALGMSWTGTLIAALTYAGCGWMLSAVGFYNVLTVAAWWPLVLAGAVRGGRRGVAWGGLACGLALLGGEPVAATLAVVPLVLVAVMSHRPRRGLLIAGAILALGALVALPQIVSTLRILPFTTRGAYGLTAAQASQYSLHPLRLLELLLPFPFGQPGTIGPEGVWAVAVIPEVPLFLSIYPGIVALWLAVRGAKRHLPWTLLAVGALLLAILGGAWGTALVRLSFGLFRYPEKFLFWFALAVPILAGWGAEALATDPEKTSRRRLGRWALASAILALVAGVLVLIGRSGLVGAMADRLGSLSASRRDAALTLVSTQLHSWGTALCLLGGTLAAAVLVARRGATSLLVFLQLLVLFQLRPLVVTDSTTPYRSPMPWAQNFRSASAPRASVAVFHELLAFPPWRLNPSYHLPPGSRAVMERAKALDLAPAPGVLDGLTYPLAPDLEGLQSPLSTILHRALPQMSWAEKTRWLQITGVEAAVVFEDPASPPLEVIDHAEHWGVTSYLARVRGTTPAAWWPHRLVEAPTPLTALQAVATFNDPQSVVTVPHVIPHDPNGSVALIKEEPDQIDLEVEGGGGVAVIRRAYEPLYVARAGKQILPTFPVDLDLLGVAVPPGRHHITLAVSGGRETAAGWVGAAVALSLLAFGALRRRPAPAAASTRAAPSAP
jgi:hypothetical protein